MTTISSGISSAGNWSGMPPPRMEGRGGGQKPSFSSIDTDGSGGLDKTEFTAMIEKGPEGAQGTQGSSGTSSTSMDDLFSKLDADGNGSISQSELDAGMKPPGQDSQGSQNAFGNMGMDTQRFASMMGSGASSSSTSSTDDAQALFDMIDSDKSGDLSKSEVSSFQDKMKALFDTMQQMGAQQFQSTSSSLSVTA